MKHISITKEQFDKINPKHICVPKWIGSDDIHVERGDEIIQCALNKTNSLNEALNDILEDVSGNSFEIIGFIDNELVIIKII